MNRSLTSLLACCWLLSCQLFRPGDRIDLVVEVRTGDFFRELAHSALPALDSLLDDATRRQAAAGGPYVAHVATAWQEAGKPLNRLALPFMAQGRPLQLASSDEAVLAWLADTLQTELDHTAAVLAGRIEALTGWEPEVRVAPTAEGERIYLGIYGEVNKFALEAILLRRGVLHVRRPWTYAKAMPILEAIAGRDSAEAARFWSVLKPLPADDPSQAAALAVTQDTAQVNAWLHDPRAKFQVPEGTHFRWLAKPLPGTDVYELYLLWENRDDLKLSGPAVTRCQVQESAYLPDTWEILIDMAPSTANAWASLTQKSVGLHLALEMDGKVYSVPRVMEPMRGGKAMLTGHFSRAEAEALAALIAHEALPLPLTIR